MRPEWSALEANVAAIPAWLEGDQPDGAIIDHFGYGVHCGGMLHLDVAVCGWNGGPGGERGTADTCRVHIGNERHDPDEPQQDPLTEAERAEVATLLERAGLTVADRWGSDRWESYGCTYPRINPTLKTARRRYSDGCPKPGHHVFCGERATWGWPDGYVPTDDERERAECTWKAGFELTVPPAWVAVPWDFPGPAPADNDGVERNLDIVRRAVHTTRDALVDLGVHPSTITAGRRGDIVGDPGDLSFDEGTGLGVNMPAELAERLVKLAAAAHRFGITEADT